MPIMPYVSVAASAVTMRKNCSSFAGSAASAADNNMSVNSALAPTSGRGNMF